MDGFEGKGIPLAGRYVPAEVRNIHMHAVGRSVGGWVDGWDGWTDQSMDAYG